MQFLFDKLLNLPLPRAKINRDFRRWHVEALLNQAADLTDRCLDELRELRSLHFAKTQFEIGLEKEENELANDNQLEKNGGYNRNINSIELRLAYLKNSFFKDVNEIIRKRNEFNNSLSDDKERKRDHIELLESLLRINSEPSFEIQALVEQKKYAELDFKYSTDLLIQRRTYLKEKKALQGIGGVFSFQDQIEEVEKRLIRDYSDALVRLVKAQEGLKDIYGFDVPLPNKPQNPVSELSIWNREAIEFIVAYQQLDQAFTKVISIRSILGETQWSLLETNQVSFELDPNLFNQHENVRFRGIGASIIGKAGIIPWSVIVTLPGKAVYRRQGIDIKPDFNQDDLPSCLIGKVENRNSFRAMEYCGTVSLMNASPIGQSNNAGGLWRISVIKPDSNSEIFSAIDDIILEINVVGQPI